MLPYSAVTWNKSADLKHQKIDNVCPLKNKWNWKINKQNGGCSHASASAYTSFTYRRHGFRKGPLQNRFNCSLLNILLPNITYKDTLWNFLSRAKSWDLHMEPIKRLQTETKNLIFTQFSIDIMCSYATIQKNKTKCQKPYCRVASISTWVSNMIKRPKDQILIEQKNQHLKSFPTQEIILNNSTAPTMNSPRVKYSEYGKQAIHIFY